jgi:hypothetical protein
MGHPRRFERAPATSGFSRSPLSSPIRAREPRSEAAAAAADRTIPNQPTELPGRLRHQPIAKSAALAGGMVLFIPWRVVAEESGAAHFGFGGAMLPDLLGPMVRPPAAPSISILVFHRALPDLQRMKHKPDQAFGHREECFVSS